MERYVSIKSICEVGFAVLAPAAVIVTAFAACPGTGAFPQRLAIYYGYPSLVNGAHGDLSHAVRVFSNYDVIVLGDGLEFDTPRPNAAGPQEHRFTSLMIRALHRTPRRPVVYGYVPLGNTQRLTLEEVTDRIDLWERMGADGVFFDEAGYDFGVTRERQNAAVAAAHARGLSACLNAFRPADVFLETRTDLNAAGGGNPNALPPLISARDAVLLESFAVRNGVPEPADSLEARTREALEGRARFGTRVFAIATSDGDGDHAAQAEFGWWAASVFGLDGYGWGMQWYSAAASQLPWMRRPDAETDLAGATPLGDVSFENGRWHRTTTVGTIVVDTTTRQGALEKR
jgi:hypothetical protein